MTRINCRNSVEITMNEYEYLINKLFSELKKSLKAYSLPAKFTTRKEYTSSINFCICFVSFR